MQGEWGKSESGEAQEIAGAGSYRVLDWFKESRFYFKFNEDSPEVFEEDGQGPVRRLFLAQGTQWHLGLGKGRGGMLKSCQIQTVF